MQSIKYLFIISDKKEDKQSTSNKDERRFDSQTKSGKRNKYYNHILYRKASFWVIFW